MSVLQTRNVEPLEFVDSEARAGRAPAGIDEKIGARIRRRRVQLNLEESQLAALVGMTPSSLRRCEIGRRTLPVRDLIEFATHLDVSVDYFYADLSCPQAPSPSELIDDTQTRALLDAFARIDDPHLRSQFASLVRAIAARQAPVSADHGRQAGSADTS